MAEALGCIVIFMIGAICGACVMALLSVSDGEGK